MTNIAAIENALRFNLGALANEIAQGSKVVQRSDGYRVGKRASLLITYDGWYSFEHSQGSKSLIGLIQFTFSLSWREAVTWAQTFTIEYPVGLFSPPIKSVNYETKLSLSHYIYHQQARDLAGTMGQKYLTNDRKLRDSFVLSKDVRKIVRFCDSLKHPDGDYSPALVMPLTGPDDSWAGILRIYLNPKTGGKFCGGSVSLLGKPKGAAIRFGKPISQDVKNQELIVCEGPEDALSILQSCPASSVWCGVGSNVRNLLIPRGIKRVMIAIDNDEAGAKIGMDLSKRLLLEGRQRVAIMAPKYAKDFNEVLKTGKWSGVVYAKAR